MKLLKKLNHKLSGVLSRAANKKCHWDAILSAEQLKKLASCNGLLSTARHMTLKCLDNVIKEKTTRLNALINKREGGREEPAH